jgi:flagellar basal body rod protein FlgG
MKNPLATVTCALLFLLSGVAVAEFLAQSRPEQTAAPQGSAAALQPTPSISASPLPAAASFAVSSHPFAPDSGALPDDTISAGTQKTTHPVQSEEHVAAVRTLVKQYLPDASDEIVEVLVEEYQQCDLAGVEFMLDQRQQSGLMMPASLSTPWSTSDSATSVQTASRPSERTPTASTSTPSSMQSVFASAERLIARNLVNCTTAGYRRVIPVLDVIRPDDSQFESTPDVLPDTVNSETSPGLFSVPATPPATTAASTNQLLAIWSFEPGQVVFTGNDRHVALATEPHLMLAFADGTVVSRRGDLQILSDRRIGIQIGTTELPLYESPVLDDQQQGFSITASGEICTIAVDGAIQQVGQLQVARIANLARLTSSDGVIFRCPDSEPPAMTTDVHFEVQALELSNVDRDDAWQELEHFRRVQSELSFD